MYRFFSRVLYILLFALIAGCVSSDYSVKGDYAFEAGNNEGLIAFSTRWEFTCPPPSLLMDEPGIARINITDGDDSETILLKNTFVDSSYKSHFGYFYVKALPNGNYKFHHITFSLAGATFIAPEFSIPFTVSQGNTVYLGELSVKVSNCGYATEKPKTNAQYDINISDQWIRDKDLFKAYMQNVNPASVELRILKPGTLSLYTDTKGADPINLLTP